MTATEARADTRPDLAGLLPLKNWKWFVVRGVLAIALGVLAILFPASALFAFAMVFAAFMFVDGLVSLTSGLSGAAAAKDRWWTLILRGVAGLVIGILFVLMPVITTFSYGIAMLVLVSAWSITTGIFEIGAAIRLRKEIKGEWLLGLSGALSVLLGIGIAVLLGLYPAASVLSAAWVAGLFAVAIGVVLIVQGVRLSRKGKEPQTAQEQAPSPPTAATT